jgi:glutaredoxin-related protein
MARSILDELNIHSAIRKTVSEHFRDTVQEVQTTIGQHRIVVIGMSGNPVVSKARKLLKEKNLEFKYLEYGSYFNQWRRRTSLKMWTGWATFPMVFVDGTLIGGYRDLKALDDSGELSRMLVSGGN